MMMKLKRIAKRDTYTIGKLYVNDKYFCDTLEDKDRGLTDNMTVSEIQKIKVKGETAIPTGKYEVIINYSNRFKKLMPLLLNVKGFEGIRVHGGTTSLDTQGCLLLGENKVVGKVINSRVTCNKLYAVIKEALDKKEKVFIEIH